MRLLSWTFWRTLLWKSDDALARALPLAELPLPAHQLRLVVPESPVSVSPIETAVETIKVPSAPQRPLAKQLAVQRHLTRIAKRKRPASRLKSKPKPKKTSSPPRRNSAAANRPSSKRASAAKRKAGKKRTPARRHVWLAAKR